MTETVIPNNLHFMFRVVIGYRTRESRLFAMFYRSLEECH